MEGTILYPLNELKELKPDIYREHVAEYHGREKVMEQKIPILDCLWSDVVHFAAVHPSKVKQALLDAGVPNIGERKFYQINPHLLDPAKTVFFLHRYGKAKFAEDFEIYNPDSVGNYATLSDTTKEYYREMIASGRNPLAYHAVPHILYKGSLDMAHIPIICV